MATSKVEQGKLKTRGSVHENEPSADPLDERKFSDLKLKDFEMLKTIGMGSYGRVVQCRLKEHSKYYAMKILEIADTIKREQVDHVKNEKSLLAEVQHPFIVDLYWTHHDDSCLYMLFEYICGGELFIYLRYAGRFSNDTSMFYAAEIILALEYLHDFSIVYRDLKPENLMLDREGHIKITDFGFAKKLHDKTWTMCGTLEYVAPELILEKGYDTAIDWWALGILTYEMLAGFPPFSDADIYSMYEKLIASEIDWSKHIQPTAKDLIAKLLAPDPKKRLGNVKCGADDVKNHGWFKTILWNDVYTKRIKPPIIPKVSHEGDTRNHREYPDKAECSFQADLSEDFLTIFKDF